MKRMLIEAIALVLLAVVGGVIANVVRSGDDETYLPWSTDLYGDPVVKTDATPSAPAPSADPAQSSPGGSPAGSAAGAGEPTPGAGDSPPGAVTTPESGTEPVGTEPVAPPPDDDHAGGEFPKIGFEDALAELQAGSAFVDARRTREYVLGHITSAVSISPYEQARLGEKIGNLRAEVPAEMTVVVYCNASADCEDSAIIARQLRIVGFMDLRIYQGGFPEWDAKLKDDPRRATLITEGGEPGELDG